MTDPEQEAVYIERCRVNDALARAVERTALAHLSTEAGPGPGARVLTAAVEGPSRTFEFVVTLPRGRRLARVTVETVE